MQHAEYEAQLWIGAPGWPAEARLVDPLRQWDVPRLDLWEGIAIDEFQIGGMFCHHQRFYGLKLAVPRTDALSLLAHSYLASSLPGCSNRRFATPLEEIVRVRDRLAALDLVLDPVHYARFAEAYVPVTAESAWRYAIARRLEVLVRFPEREVDIPVDLASLGLSDAWDDITLYLTQQWQRIERELYPRRHPSMLPESWTAVVHYPNSD